MDESIPWLDYDVASEPLPNSWQAKLFLTFSERNAGLEQPIFAFDRHMFFTEGHGLSWKMLFNSTAAANWSSEKYLRAVYQLAPGTCSTQYTDEDMKYRESYARQGDAGTIDLEVHGERYPAEYSEVAHSYPILVKPQPLPFSSGVPMHVKATGGSDVGPFEVSSKSLRIELLEPRISNGELPQPPLDRPLTVRWRAVPSQGPIPEAVGIVLHGEWFANLDASGSWYGFPYGYNRVAGSWVVCRAQDGSEPTGEFTIPAELLAQLPRNQTLTLDVVGFVPVEFTALHLERGQLVSEARASVLLDLHEIAPTQQELLPGLPKAQMAPELVSASCTADDDCGGGFCPSMLIENHYEYFIDGYCTAGCQSDADCPSTAGCHQPGRCDAALYPFCAKRCQQHADCGNTKYYLCSEGLCLSTMMVSCW